MSITILDPIHVEDHANLNEDIDELSERLVLNFSKGDFTKNSVALNGLTPKGTILPTTPLPYSSNIQDTPFARGRTCSDFFSAVKAIQEQDESRNLSLSPGLLKNLNSNQSNSNLTLTLTQVASTESSVKNSTDGKKALQ